MVAPLTQCASESPITCFSHLATVRSHWEVRLYNGYEQLVGRSLSCFVPALDVEGQGMDGAEPRILRIHIDFKQIHENADEPD